MNHFRFTKLPAALGAVFTSAVLSAVAVLGAADSFAGDAGNVAQAKLSIRGPDLKEHISVLASDTLEGREAGTRGGQAAGAYLITFLKQQGLAPKGVDANYEQPFGYDFRNLLAVIPGMDPKLRDEYILICAHYDHVGYGNARNSYGPTGYIHNGADDNASGTSSLLEMIEAFSQYKIQTRRSLLFAFWDAEEMGLLGSEHWIANPTVPLSQVKMVFNVDMVGRLQNNTVAVHGVRTGYGLRRMVSELNDDRLRLDFTWEVKRNSDHYPFYERQIPYLMLYTGEHEDYHRPTDDVDKIDFDGLQKISRLLFALVRTVADSPQVTDFRRDVFHEDVAAQQSFENPPDDAGPRFGLAWNPDLAAQGIIEVVNVVPGFPAEQAGLRIGDRILQLGGRVAGSSQQFAALVTRAVNPVKLQVRRAGDGESLDLTAHLQGCPNCFGIVCRRDAADPRCVTLGHVTPDSPAAQAGLKANDRIYRIAGKPFASMADFQQTILAKTGAVKLSVERAGSLRDVELQLPSQPAP